nr:ankyrin repeat-containing protein [Tanacetum cinerariifolium]
MKNVDKNKGTIGDNNGAEEIDTRKSSDAEGFVKDNEIVSSDAEEIDLRRMRLLMWIVAHILMLSMVMNPEGLNNAMELVVSIEDNQLYEGVMQSKGVVAIVRQTTSKGDNFRRMTEPEIQDRKAKGLCFRCEEKYTPGHQCASRTLQVMLVDESDEAEEPDFNFKSWDRGSKID